MSQGLCYLPDKHLACECSPLGQSCAEIPQYKKELSNGAVQRSCYLKVLVSSQAWGCAQAQRGRPLGVAAAEGRGHPSA